MAAAHSEVLRLQVPFYTINRKETQDTEILGH